MADKPTLLDDFKKTRSRTEALCQPLHIEDYIPQPFDFASPPKWHLSHSTWFFEEMVLKKYKPGYVQYDGQFSYLFNSYYQSVGPRSERSLRGAMSRPTVKATYEYRAYVDEQLSILLSEANDSDIEELVTLGINHEQQHQELLITDLKHTFSLNPLGPVYLKDFDLTNSKNELTGWLSMDEGIYAIGHHGKGFAFDNEHARHKQYLEKYELSLSLVTNGEYIAYMDANGYEQSKYWLDDGWAWKSTNNVNAPLYWHKLDGEWYHYTLAGIKKIDPEAMLTHVSFYEAQAYATWRNLRLPTEYEWEAAADLFDWGNRWEWTYSAYIPYPNFSVSEGAVGEYNGKFMINQMVLRGSSVATSQGHSRKTYRNFFTPEARWQYTGIRLAK